MNTLFASVLAAALLAAAPHAANARGPGPAKLAAVAGYASVHQDASLPSLHTGTPASKADIARYAEQLLANNYAEDGPGAAVIVARGDEVLFRGARGMASIELGVPLSPERVFEIGSISKQFAAVGLMKLVEQGKLALDDPLTKFVPDYPDGSRVTVRMLLNHTSGIKSIAENEGDFFDRFLPTKMTTAQVINAFKNEKPDFAPGEGWHYNNSGYVLVGAVIEAVSGMPWHEYLKQTLFDPLGLAHTGYGDETVAVISGHAVGYHWHDDRWATARYIDMTVPNAAGALVSTVDDLLRWNRALHEGKVLKSDSYRQMISPAGKAVKGRYGFAIFHETLRGADMLQHGGDIFGFGGYLLYLPQSRLSVAVLCNTDFIGMRPGTLSVETLARLLAAYAIGRTYPEKKAISVDANTLKQYEGVYRIDKDSVRVLRVAHGKLTSQRTDSPAYPLIPIAKDEFLFDTNDVLSRMVFERNAAGLVSAMRFFAQDEGDGDLVPRTDEPLPMQHTTVTLPKPALQRLVGRYAHEEMEMAVSLDSGALKAQMSGEPVVELFAESPTRFFLKVVDAILEFTPGDGPPASMTLRQGGDTIEFKRKP